MNNNNTYNLNVHQRLKKKKNIKNLDLECNLVIVWSSLHSYIMFSLFKSKWMLKCIRTIKCLYLRQTSNVYRELNV